MITHVIALLTNFPTQKVQRALVFILKINAAVGRLLIFKISAFKIIIKMSTQLQYCIKHFIFVHYHQQHQGCFFYLLIVFQKHFHVIIFYVTLLTG